VDAHEEIESTIAVGVGECQAAAFTGDADTGFRRAQGAEVAGAVALEQQSDAGVLSGGLGVDAKEILRKGEVDMAVAVEVAGDEGVGRGPLGFGGERDGFEALAAVQEKGGARGLDFGLPNPIRLAGEKFLEAGAGVGGVGRVSDGDPGERG